MKKIKQLSLIILSLSFINFASAATYKVPVDPVLDKYAQFDLMDFEKTTSDDIIQIRYRLPETLTGKTQWVELEGMMSPDITLLFGDNAQAICIGEYTLTNCTIEYNNIEINQAEALRAIKKISISDEEVSGRIEVMKAFSTDPVGILSY